MAELRSKVTWTLELDNDELLLVLKGLRGQLLKEEHAQAASVLGARLSLLRMHTMRAAGKTADQIERGMEQAE